MTRRTALVHLGTILGTAVTLQTSSAAHHDARPSPAEDCARSCAACLIECAKHVHHCTLLLVDGQKSYARCLELCSASASACSACIQSCFGPAGTFAAQACAAMCEICAAEWERFQEDDAMIKCAKACRQCARACHAFAKSGVEHNPK